MPVDSGRRQLWINDKEISDIAAAAGFRCDLESFTNPRSGVADKFATQGVPGRLGEVVLSTRASAQKNVVTFNVRVFVSTLANLEFAVEALLAALMTGGRVRIRTDLSTSEFYARLVPPLTTTDEEPYNGNVLLGLNFELDDPLGYAPNTALLLTLPNAQAVAVALGTGPSGWNLRLRGPAINPIATYRDGRGISRGFIRIVATLAATDYVDVLEDINAVYLVTGGVVSSLSVGLQTLDQASRFPVMAPTDAYYGFNPTWTVADDSATATGRLTYRQSFR